MYVSSCVFAKGAGLPLCVQVSETDPALLTVPQLAAKEKEVAAADATPKGAKRRESSVVGVSCEL